MLCLLIIYLTVPDPFYWISRIYFLIWHSVYILFSRTAVGLPLEEPGKYIDDPDFWGKEYHKSNPVYRVDVYEQEKKNRRKAKAEADLETQYIKILGGKQSKWYEMSYDGYMARKQYLARKARLEALRRKKEAAARKKNEVEEPESEGEEEEVDDYDDDIDFDYSIFGKPRDEAWDSEPENNETDISTLE